jgi:DNA-binding transcriptional MerR regulator
MYSIKAITSLTGLTAETLRAWERRYDCITPQRNETGRRSYTQADLDKLKLLVSLTQNGHAISKIANLSCEELQNFQNQYTRTGHNLICSIKLSMPCSIIKSNGLNNY